MQFDPTNFIFGAVCGAVIAFLLRLQSLKSLQFDIKKLGIGLGVEGFEEKPSGGQRIDVSGNNNKVAGRDLIEKLDKLHTDFAEIQQSFLHQNQAINKYFQGENGKLTSPRKYLINTIYERGERIADGMTLVIERRASEGWQLEFFSSDYNGIDGVFLIFSRPATDSQIDVEYYAGSRMEHMR